MKTFDESSQQHVNVGKECGRQMNDLSETEFLPVPPFSPALKPLNGFTFPRCADLS